MIQIWGVGGMTRERVWKKQRMKWENYLLRESLIIRDKRIPWMMPRAVLEASIYVEGKWDRCTIPSVAEMTLNFRMSVSGVVPLPFSSIYEVIRR